MPVLTVGATLIVVEKYSASRFWSQIREFKATVTQCVAMMLRTLMLQPPSPDDRNHELREILYFLPVSDAEKEAFEQRFGVSLMNTYGSTESIGWVLTDPPTGRAGGLPWDARELATRCASRARTARRPTRAR